MNTVSSSENVGTCKFIILTVKNVPLQQIHLTHHFQKLLKFPGWWIVSLENSQRFQVHYKITEAQNKISKINRIFDYLHKYTQHLIIE